MNRADEKLNQEMLIGLLWYNQSTGVFSWKKNRDNTIKKGMAAGALNYGGYIVIGINREHYLAHRLAWLYVHGEWPEDQIDHINHSPADNRIENLREVSSGGNSLNISLQGRSLTKITGVHWHKSHNRWQAHIKKGGEDHYLGLHADFFNACCARKSAEHKLGFHKNHGK